jgi:hypothetical protein
MKESILTGDLSLESLASFLCQEIMMPNFDGPPIENGAREVMEKVLANDVPL